MTAVSLYAIVLALLGVVPGETTGWGTGEVEFEAYVRTSEHQEVYPICSGQYTVQVSIRTVLDDPGGVLDYVTSVDMCYDEQLRLVPGDMIEVRGTYHDGACPLPFCGRVEASSVYKVDEWDEPEEEEEPEDIESPRVLTDSAQATETTVTLQGLLLDDGGDFCRCRFLYRRIEDRWWNTEWIKYLTTGAVFSQKVAGLTPGTRYYYSIEAENSAGWDSGRQGTFVTLVETVPPIPHPAAWVTEPVQVDTTSITMMAHSARDLAGPEEYAFDFVSSMTGGAGGSDSPWQFSPLFLDVGLNPNHQYGYRVKARDSHGNETAYSPIRYAYTDIETPASVTAGAITTNSIQVKSSTALSGLTRGSSGLKLENVTTGEVSAWQQDNAFWTSGGLLPNTQYRFWAQARNGNGDLTPFSSELGVYTLAMVPTPVVFSDVTVNQLFAQWGANGNPGGTQYWCQNTVKGGNSGWITGTQWLDTGLSPNVKYTYRVKARNGDGVETALSAEVSRYSAIETPTGIVFGTITPNSIQVRSANTPSGLSLGESGLWLENVTTGQTSSWRRDNSFWASDGLVPNCRYGFRARARNGDGVQSPPSETAYIHTQANAPTRVAFSGVAATSIQVQWGPNGNPSGTLYLCENTTAGMNSGWTTGATWDNTGLTPNTRYAYRVKARNADGVETAWTDLGAQSTEYRSLTVSATPGGKVSAPGQDVFRYAPGATVNLAAAPLAGYHFLRWTGSAVDAGRVADPSAAQTTVLVDAHYTLTANFLRTRIYVDARAIGAKDGSSWTNACTSLQEALDLAQVGNEIRIAQGTYKPDKGKNVLPGDRFAAFELKSGAAFKGGYAGLGHADPNARDIAVYRTTLSGDLNGNDSAIWGSYDLYSDISRTDNSFHVVSVRDADSATLLEGVTITAGNGIDGAGICLIHSSPVISQCTIRANRAGQLSGDGLDGWGQGAGISCYLSEPMFLGCTFLSNWAGGQGGGLYCVESNPVLMSCAFQDNQSGMQGGGMYGEDCNSVWVDCTFHANWSWDGGAIYNDEGGHSRVTSCRFFGNAGHGSGGAVFDASQGLEITNSVFSGNLADVDGGAMALVRGPAVLANCTFNRNVAEGKQAGQALAVRETTVSLANCILWDHLGLVQEQIAAAGTVEHSAELIVEYCDIPGGVNGIIRKGTATVTWGGGNIDADPRFQSPLGPDRVVGTEDDDLRVRAGSPCVDAGDNTAVPADADDLDLDDDRLERIPFDLNGQPRFADHPDTADTGWADAPLYPKIVDIGAYELGNTPAF
jgi:hypothetical protein